MNSADRLKGLIAIWIAFAFATGFSFGGDVTTAADIVLALVFGLAAVIGTGMVMSLKVEEQGSSSEMYKAKRGKPDIYEMVDSLDDEELRLLRQRLMSDSDSAMPLHDLMPRQQNQSQK
jgi:hypothetical protein